MSLDTDLCLLPAVDQAELVATGRLSAVELVRASLDRIRAVDPVLNCFADVWEAEALADAGRADDDLAHGRAGGLLQGIPVAVKDTTPTAGHRTTLGSVTHKDWVPERDALVVRALRRAGAIVLGKTTAPEFACTLVTESRLLGVTRNPWDHERTPGGSSGGSAVAVATGCVALAEGTDMGGSVRIPAAWCGVVGLKPSLGRIPMDALPWLFDQMSHHGPLARRVDDARLFLAATQGPDDADIQSLPTTLDLTAPTPDDVSGLRLALSLDLGSWPVDDAVAAAVNGAASALAERGATVTPTDLLVTPRDDEVWWELWGVFMAAFYGDLLDGFREQMDPLVVHLIERGRRLSAVEVKRLDRERTELWKRVAAVLAEHDAILCPTMASGPLPASRSPRRTPTPPAARRRRSPDMTSVFNLIAACPAISVPCGWDEDGLPVGLQVVGRRWRDDVVLRIARGVEAALPHAFRHPPVRASGDGIGER